MYPTSTSASAPKGGTTVAEAVGLGVAILLIFGIVATLCYYCYRLNRRNRPAAATPAIVRGNGGNAVVTTFKRVVRAVWRR